ncbi:MAG TPA: TIGR03620 family F420-dependent LLM class oxidoreductase [Myxococcota bacterium]|nr:TIGR03620 family F420-dependent LLM class oxidoreductase [Myxococcota bacterium]
MEIGKLGKLGVWTWLDHLPAPEAAEFANRLEEWGYGSLWLPEAVGRDPFSIIGYLAARTSKLVLATGIANIYARDPVSMRAIRETLNEASQGRFLLGLGVSHEPMVTGLRHHVYGKPVATMRNYLEAMSAATYLGPTGAEPAPVVLAALRPNMLALSRDLAQGAHPYFVPPEHTARAREILGKGGWLCPEQMVLLETDARRARAIARQNMQIYLGLPNYRNNLKWLGYTDADLDNGGSDRLVDAIVAWGDEKVIADRIQAHHDAGADHVCIQTFRSDGERGFDARVLETFAPARQ